LNEALHDQAALFALGLLEGEEARAFEQVMARDAELRSLVAELQGTTAEMAHAVAPVPPPPQIKSRVMAAIKNKPVRQMAPVTPRSSWALLGWGMAAALAVGSLWLWTGREQLSARVAALTQSEGAARAALLASEEKNKSLTKELGSSQSQIARLNGEVQALRTRDEQSQATLAQLAGEVDAWRKRDAMARMEIATLQSSVEAYKQGVAVVVWDSEKHQGVLKLEKMPPIDPQKDYQLWVVDPAKKAPVNAGVVRVDEKGFARIDFKPVDAVTSAAKFALSVERKGGVPQNEGPIVFIGP
jgi:anti-sigma-K factor RskA